MPKLKQADRRPIQVFGPGDLVRMNDRYLDGRGGSRKNPGIGIVLQILAHQPAESVVPAQNLLVHWGGTEEGTFTVARQYARKRVKDLGYIPVNSETITNDLIHRIGKQEDWLLPPSQDELDMERFMDMFDDLP